jgi:hypothetical protein
MTPVMDRCACPAAYPIAECVTCTPTPDEGLYPDHRQPIPPPAPRAPADDPHGLAQPNTTCVLVLAPVPHPRLRHGRRGLVVWGVSRSAPPSVRSGRNHPFGGSNTGPLDHRPATIRFTGRGGVTGHERDR